MKYSLLGFVILIAGTIAAYNKVIRAPQCLFMADIGPCNGSIRVFGYDYLTNRCVHYFYGGCGGNPNRFATRSECMKTCYVENAEGGDEVEDAKFDLYYKDEL
ncbi:kunitz-type serine protease inhibitor 2 [Drosophila grimshawi]|uniref:GH13263 n=1 Tax=Drosophila grimshawi TaxID=7222 RepID=B4JQ58_DROGR|nr:kunitz-type serine protease inhibitor 2 [Drosophila grimshawi]EDV99038.1 GH13263 [Drosophila grimshawi]